MAGAGMVGLGYLTGGTSTAVGTKLIGTAVGTGANAFFQLRGSDPFSYIDLGIAAGTSFLTTGMGLVSSVVTNVGGTVVGSGIRGENPNAGMAGAAGGTVAGYGLGMTVQAGFSKYLAPLFKDVWKPQWVDAGMGFGIVKPAPPSPVPGVAGGVVSSFVQEPTGDSIKNIVQKRYQK